MAEQATWKTAECPFVVEYATRVADDIRLAVLDAFFSLPRGGAEIGGILLGKWEDGRLVISDFAPLECEHAFGPSFTLSPRDRAGLAELIASKQGAGVQVAGWYHSHTRSDIFLSEADRDIHSEFFPEPWQVALVLRPHAILPTRAGFFFREADGSIRQGASCLELTLEALEPKPSLSAAPGILGISPASQMVVDAVPAPAARQPEAAPPPAPNTPPPPPVAIPSGPAAVPSGPAAVPSAPAAMPSAPAAVPSATAAMQSGPAAVPSAPVASSPAPAAMPSEPAVTPFAPEPPPMVEPRPAAEHIPSFLHTKPDTPRRWPKVVIPLLVGAAVGAPAYLKRDLWLPHVTAPAASAASAALGVNTVDFDGQLQIRWDRSSPAVLQGTHGILNVTNAGAVPQLITLDHDHLASGILTVARQSDRVDVSLSVTEPDGNAIREVTSFLGKLPERAPGKQDAAAPSQKQTQQAGEIAQLRADLDEEIDRNRRLKRDVDFISKQLRDQARARLMKQAPDKK